MAGFFKRLFGKNKDQENEQQAQINALAQRILALSESGLDSGDDIVALKFALEQITGEARRALGDVPPRKLEAPEPVQDPAPAPQVQTPEVEPETPQVVVSPGMDFVRHRAEEAEFEEVIEDGYAATRKEAEALLMARLKAERESRNGHKPTWMPKPSQDKASQSQDQEDSSKEEKASLEVQDISQASEPQAPAEEPIGDRAAKVIRMPGVTLTENMSQDAQKDEVSTPISNEEESKPDRQAKIISFSHPQNADELKEILSVADVEAVTKIVVTEMVNQNREGTDVPRTDRTSEQQSFETTEAFTEDDVIFSEEDLIETTPETSLFSAFAEDEQQSVSEASKHVMDPEAFVGRHVLLAAGKKGLDETVKSCLDKWKITYKEAYNGLKVVEGFSGSENNEFDGILLEQQMFLLGGLAAAKNIRRLKHVGANVPIGILGDEDGVTQADCDAAGVNAFTNERTPEAIYGMLRILFGMTVAPKDIGPSIEFADVNKSEKAPESGTTPRASGVSPSGKVSWENGYD